MNAISLILFMCLLLAVEDSTLPTYLRLLAGNIFRVDSEFPDTFYEKYRYRRKLRALVGILLAVGVGVTRLLSMPVPVQASAVVIAVVGYGGLIVYDMFRSRPGERSGS